MKAKQKIETIQLDKARGAQPELGLSGLKKRNETQYFCSLEKSRGKKKVMTKLRRTMGETTTNQREILQEQVTYKNLYHQSPVVDDIGEATSRFVLNEDMPTLDENDAATCISHQLRTQHLFSIDLIWYKGKVLFILKLQNKGIQTINNVIHPDEKRLFFS